MEEKYCPYCQTELTHLISKTYCRNCEIELSISIVCHASKEEIDKLKNILRTAA